MDVLFVSLLLVIVFAVGPVVAAFDVLSRELFGEDGHGIRTSRLAKALLVLLVPLAWIVYFVAFRRRRPFSDG